MDHRTCTAPCGRSESGRASPRSGSPTRFGRRSRPRSHDEEAGGLANGASVLGHSGLDVTGFHYVKSAVFTSDQRQTLSTLARKQVGSQKS